MAYAYYRKLLDEKRKAEQPKEVTETVTEPPQATAIRRPPETYHPSKAPIQPSPPPTPETAKPGLPTALELRRQEYMTFAQEYVKPTVESAMEAIAEAPKPPPYTAFTRPTKGLVQQWLEREVFPKEREAAARKFEEQQLKPVETKARAEFEAAIQTEKEKLPPEMRGAPEVVQWEAQERQRFGATLTEWKAEQTQAFKKWWKPKGLAERLLDIGKTEPLPQIRGVDIWTGKPQITYEPIRPLAGIAGFVAYPETLAYAGMTWTGKEPPTLPPPSPFGELRGTEYARGYATAMVVTSLIFGEAASKGFAKTVTPKAQAWLTKQYLRDPLGWKGLPERIVMKITGARPHIAPQVVSVSIAGEPPYTLPPTFGLKTGLVKYGVAEARAMAWALAETPKTSGLLIAKMPEKLAGAWVKEHLFKTAMGGLSYALVEEQLRKSLGPQMPYIPRDFYVPKPPMFLPMLVPAVTPKPSVAPKPVEVVKPKVTQLPRTPQIPKIFEKPTAIPKLAPMQVPKIFETPVVTPKVAVTQIQPQVQVQEQLETQILKEMYYEPPYLAPPKLVPPRYPDIFDLPRKRRRKRKKEPFLDLYGRYKRFWPVMSAREVMSLPTKKTLKKLMGK